MIQTGEIKMPPKKMFSVLFLQRGVFWSVVALFGIIVFVFLGMIIDPRFYILALIWLFMITPLMVLFLYFFYGMKPLTAFNSIPHRLIFSDKDILVKLIKINDESLEEDEEVNPQDNKEYSVARNEFSFIKTGSDYVLLIFNKVGWLYLPISAFSSTEEFKEVVKSFQ